MIFVDTGAFLARWLPEDGRHAEAVAGWKELENRPRRLYTSLLILNEVVTLLGRRAGARFAAERGRGILASGQMAMLRPDPDDEQRALALFEKFADQGVGFTDAMSFALMRRRGIRDAFAFDGHFARAGFALWPQAR